MGDTKFVCNARFVGRRSVDGPLNDYRLSEVVAETRLKKGLDELKCNLEFSERNLLVTFIKKDEGFESDTDSAKSLEAAAASPEEKVVPSSEEKIIKDHVFRFNESGEDSYSGSSDSETSDHNKTSSGSSSGSPSGSPSASSSASASPTAELHKYKFDHLDTYSISDVLICHTDKVYKNCVIWVIRRSGSLEALVFECTSEDCARQLYRKFHEVSKRSKLERHRRRKSDGGSIVTRDFTAVSSRELNAKAKERANITINNIDAGPSDLDPNQKWSLVQHTDKNGVTHIEVESSLPSLVSSRPAPPRDSAEPRSLLSFSPAKFSRGGGVAARPAGPANKEKSKFALELESILSNEMKRREDGSAPEKKEGEVQRSRPPGESLSLRQRAPALLLRKLDEFEEKAHKIWAKAEAEEENRKIWSKPSNSVIGISSPRGPVLDSPRPEKLRSKKSRDGKEDNRNSIVSNQQQHSDNSNATRSKVKESVTKKDDGNRILIPTKTGKEPPKKLYPKESPPIFSGRFMPIGISQVGLSPQPHSLPIYPLHGVAWNRLPTAAAADISQLDVWKIAAEAQQQQRWQPVAQDQRSRSRDRGRLDPDQRRRAQSKSPARRPVPRYLEQTSEDSRFGRMFREFGDAVRSKMGRKGEVKVSSGGTPEVALKSNLKKHYPASPPDLSPQSNNNNNSDNKKVHFNKFATVQMMA